MDDKITLLCLVYGESSYNTFPVELTKTKLIENLKDLIKIKNYSRFELFAACELTLWRVSIPAEDDSQLQSLQC